jgi:hypothetical protein
MGRVALRLRTSSLHLQLQFHAGVSVLITLGIPVREREGPCALHLHSAETC